MKKCVEITTYLLVLLVVSVTTDNTLRCQEKSQDTTVARTIDLPLGCKLVLDPKIDPTDSISQQILSGIREIMPRIQALIPADSITIDLRVSGEVLPFLGVGATTTGDHSLRFNYDPGNPNFKVEYITRNLVHECYHPVRLRIPRWQLTMLECMITEGLADHFLMEVLHGERPLWSRALSDEQIHQYLLKAKPILFEKHGSWNDEFNQKFFFPWMFGRKEDDPIPGWTGYTLGWRIVEDYLKAHPDSRASSLIFTPAEVIASETPELVESK